MDFESLKEQLIERLNSYKTQVEDSEVYIRLKERYDNLQPQYQKAIKYSAIFFLVYFIYSIPSGFVSSASEKMEFFEENRLLTRELIRAGRIDKNVKLPPAPPNASSLAEEVDRVLSAETVLPEQKMSAVPQMNIASKTLVPKSIKQGGMKASIKQLNLRQVVRVGEGFSQITGSQLMNMAVQADSKDPHYFNVEYEVATFDVPREPTPSMDSDSDKKNKSKRSKKRKKKGKK